MVSVTSLVIGVAVAVVVGSWVIKRLRGGDRSSARRRTAGQRESFERHREAQGREPPVDVGDVREVAVHEFTEHHTGERQAVCKIQGFVVFVEDVPAALEVGDVVEITILSFNRGHTSATARYVGRA